MTPLLTIVVPAYQAAEYLDRAVGALARADLPVEVVIVDDGSSDETGRIADGYAAAHPERFRVVHQDNRGHGGAINAGLAAARGLYTKVLDADDWLDQAALEALLDEIERLEPAGVDAIVTNYVHERVGRGRRAVRFRSVMPAGRPFGWDEVGRFGKRQYLMMHALVYRTELLRRTGLELPEHTFYVDNLFVVAPLALTRRLVYLDVDLYRYYIGRADQSVDERVMVRRVDQQVRVNRLVLRALPTPTSVPKGLYSYLVHHVDVLCGITSIMLVRAGTPEHLAQREAFWRDIRADSPHVYQRLRRGVIGTSANLPGGAGRRMSLLAYRVARRVVGFS